MATCAVFRIQTAPPYSLLLTVDRDLVSGLLATNAVAQCRIHEKDERQRRIQVARDSPLEGDGFEPPVPRMRPSPLQVLRRPRSLASKLGRSWGAASAALDHDRPATGSGALTMYRTLARLSDRERPDRLHARFDPAVPAIAAAEAQTVLVASGCRKNVTRRKADAAPYGFPE